VIGVDKAMENSEIKSDHALTRLGPSTHFQGNLEASEDVLVEGQVEGQIILHGHKLIISPSGRVRGDVEADEVFLQGSQQGNISASSRVTLASEATLTGDINAARVAIEAGAKFKGTIKITSHPPSK